MRLHHLVLCVGLSWVLAMPSFARQPRREVEVDPVEQARAERTQADERRSVAIERLLALIRDESGDRKAEMLLRLADLYFQRGRDRLMGAMEDHQTWYDTCFQTAADPDDCDERQPDLEDAHSWYGRSAKVYGAVVKGYPRFQRVDDALFHLGVTETELGHIDEAVSAFKKLVKLYPTSSWVPDAYVQIGEYYFERDKAMPALSAYARAARFTDHPRWSFAAYKLAWCQYNLEHYDKAIASMKQVVSHARGTEGTSTVRLEEEALKDLVRFFADADELDEAYRYFTSLGRPELIRAMLVRLAKIHQEQGKHVQSVETWRRLMMESPTHEDNAGYQRDIIGAYRQLADHERVLEEVARLRRDYGRASAWQRAQLPDVRNEADGLIESTARGVATDLNEQARALLAAQHPDADPMFDRAVRAYEAYLADFGGSSAAYDVHYDFGELLWHLERHAEAHAQYVQVVELDPKGTHSRFCAESAIFAAEEMVKAEGGGDIKMQRENISKDVEPLPLTEWEQTLVADCRRYASLYGGDKVETAIYKSAFLLYSRFHFAEAAEQFQVVIARWPDSQRAEFSAHLILDALTIQEDWTSLRDTARAFSMEESLGTRAFRGEMHEIYARSSFRVIRATFEGNGDHGAAARSYVAFVDEFPDLDVADTALHNAAVHHDSAGDLDGAMAARHRLVESFPDSRFALESQAALGYDYERLADIEQAVVWYDHFVEAYLDEPEPSLAGKASDALYTSGVFHAALGDWRAAIERYAEFEEEFAEDPRAVEVPLLAADLAAKHGAHDEAAERYAAFREDHPDATRVSRTYSILQQGNALRAAGDSAASVALFQRAVDAYRREPAEPGPLRVLVGEMMFRLTEQPMREQAEIAFAGVFPAGTPATRKNIAADSAAFERAVRRKTGGMIELSERYQEIIDLGAGRWGLAAVVALGRLYEDMADTLDAAECSFYLTESQCAFTQETLMDKGYLQRSKAIAVYELALDTAFELGLYNEDTAFARERLTRIRPGDVVSEEMLPRPGFVSEDRRRYGLETEL